MQETSSNSLSDAGTNNKRTLDKKEYKRQWNIKNKTKVTAKATKWNKDNVERRKEIVKKYNSTVAARTKNKTFRVKNRKLVIEHYSNNKNCCNCCGEKIYEFLSVDHIDGDGGIHRRSLNLRGGHHFYAWLKQNDYPYGYQILCFNCNMAKGQFGVCPHKLIENTIAPL